MHRTRFKVFLSSLLVASGLGCAAPSRQPIAQSARQTRDGSGLNERFLEADDATEWVERFERESREIYQARHQIVSATGVQPGMVVADVGAGTGLFTVLFAQRVGPEGKVYAVDIAPAFLKHIRARCDKLGLTNVEAVRGTPESAGLPDGSVDLVFVCDTYHHFEFPQRMLRSIHRALRPGGELVVVDFERIEGVSRDWVIDHVRAGKARVVEEITSAGFAHIGDVPRIEALKENYITRFRRNEHPG